MTKKSLKRKTTESTGVATKLKKTVTISKPGEDCSDSTNRPNPGEGTPKQEKREFDDGSNRHSKKLKNKEHGYKDNVCTIITELRTLYIYLC